MLMVPCPPQACGEFHAPRCCPTSTGNGRKGHQRDMPSTPSGKIKQGCSLNRNEHAFDKSFWQVSWASRNEKVFCLTRSSSCSWTAAFCGIPWVPMHRRYSCGICPHTVIRGTWLRSGMKQSRRKDLLVALGKIKKIPFQTRELHLQGKIVSSYFKAGNIPI